MGSERHLFCNRVRIGRSRSSKVVDFGTNRKGVCDFLLESLIVTLVLSRTVSEIRRLIGWHFWIFPTPLSFNALARGEPFRISGWAFVPKTSPWAIHWWRFFVILACVVFTQCQRVTDGRIDRHPDRSYNRACIAGYADGMKKLMTRFFFLSAKGP